MKKWLAKHFHLVLGATLVGPRFYGFAWPSWGIGITIGS